MTETPQEEGSEPIELPVGEPRWSKRLLSGFKRIVSDLPGRKSRAQDSVEAVVFHVTEAGRLELAERPMQLRSRLRALLVLVNGQRSAGELLRLTSDLSLDETHLLALYNYGLIHPGDPESMGQLDKAIDRVFQTEGSGPSRGARRSLSASDFDRFFGGNSRPMTRARGGVAYERLDLNWIRRAAAHAASAQQVAMRQAVTSQRQAAGAGSDLALDADAESMLIFLADRVPLFQTLTRYPRVLNRLAGAWNEPYRFMANMDNLLLDERAVRQGFPFEIVQELTDLKAFYQENVFRTDNEEEIWNDLER